MDPNLALQQNKTKPQIIAAPPPEDLMRRDRLFITIKSPDATIFTGEAVALSSMNDVGPFDVLPRHENFISILNNKIVIYREKNQKEELPIEKGIIKARQNLIQVFLGVETLGKAETKVFNPNQVAAAGAQIQGEASTQKQT